MIVSSTPNTQEVLEIHADRVLDEETYDSEIE